MARVLVKDSTLTSIADAIREKTGTTETLKPGEMADAISSMGNGNAELIGYLNTKTLSNEQANELLEEIAADYSNTYGENTVAIGDYFFYHQYNITDIIIPDEIDFYSYGAFQSCYKLANVRFSANTRVIDSGAFQHTSLETVTLPESTKRLGSYAFASIQTLKTVCFKGTLDKIDSNTFSNCKALTNIYVPWAEGAVANAPWGATNATIHYNYKE